MIRRIPAESYESMKWREERQQSEMDTQHDLSMLRKYVAYRREVVRIFTDPVRRKRLEKLAGHTGVVIPKAIFKGI